MFATEQVSRWFEAKAVIADTAVESARFLSNKLCVVMAHPSISQLIEVLDTVQN